MPSAAPPAAAGNGLPHTELEQLQLRAGEVIDESLESTRHMVELCEEGKEAGIRTLLALDDQGGASFKEDHGIWKGNEDGKVVINQPQRVVEERNCIDPQACYIGRITNDAREDEMEENIRQVNTYVGNMRNMAIDIHSELENQRIQIDRINEKAESNDSHIEEANQEVKKLLKS